MKRSIAAAVGAALVGLSLAGTGVANATPNSAVCDGVRKASSYEDYLIEAYYLGKAFDYDEDTQAQNIVQSVMLYCPWHAPGLEAAAERLSNG